MAKAVTTKQLENVRSGQTLWFVRKDQFGAFKVKPFTPTGKKVSSIKSTWDDKASKVFKPKSTFGLFSNDLYTTVPSIGGKFFWTRNAAESFATDVKESRIPEIGVIGAVIRVRKTDTSVK